MKRRAFLASAGGAIATAVARNLTPKDNLANPGAPGEDSRPTDRAEHSRLGSASEHEFGGVYQGNCLDQIAFPLGGMGAGMICLEGTGALSRLSLRHRPDLVSDHRICAAVSMRGAHRGGRVLEGPVPAWKLRPQFPGDGDTANVSWGFSRFREATFNARFPFATVSLSDEEIPLAVELTGWSPFSPGDADNASLPVAALEYQLTNSGKETVEGVFSFHAENFMAVPQAASDSTAGPSDRVLPTSGGFILYETGTEARPWDEGHFAVWVEESDAQVNHVWFRGDWPAQMRMLRNAIETGEHSTRAPDVHASSPGASLYVAFQIAAAMSRRIKVLLAWYVPKSSLFAPDFIFKNGGMRNLAQSIQTYVPWYAGRFASIDEVKSYWQSHYSSLKEATERFTRTLYDSTLPPEALEAVTANLTILKSPTVLRQIDGRLWGWEGCNDEKGAGYGSSNHVWNYAQAIPHLFPDLERTLRDTEFGPNQGRDGFQAIRAALPIRPIGDTREDAWGLASAADGQLGGIIKVYRDWRISGDTAWLRGLWPKIRASLDYCIRTWDPRRRGWIEEPHITTFDREFWGAECLCTGLYVGTLRAAAEMAKAIGESDEDYAHLVAKGLRQLENRLFNGEYFFQRIEWKNLATPFPSEGHDPLGILAQYPEILKFALKDGPPYQYGDGCFSTGLMGSWLCLVSGLGNVLDIGKVRSHLLAVHRHNFKRDLTGHASVAGYMYACGAEAGLLSCTWPRDNEPSIPVLYADEVWEGTEYQVASHLIALGHITQGLEILQATRRRYDGAVRNPFDSVESGHWYARAMSSYALLQAFTGARFDAVEKVLYLKPVIKGDFRCFLSTATGFGTVGVKNGQPFVEVVFGVIPFERIRYDGTYVSASRHTP